jgi:hypothetical protein
MDARTEKKVSRADTIIKSGEVEKGLKIYRDLIFDSSLSATLRSQILVRLFAVHVDEGLELLTKIRDAYIFLDDKGKESTIKILEETGCTKVIPIFQRMVNATFLYNRICLKESVSVFSSVAIDPECEFVFRVDSCKYMFGTGVQEYQEQASKFLISIISSHEKPSIDRYRVIVSFLSKSGIVTYINTGKIGAPYDEEFAYKLQIVFFRDIKNGIRERILSGQYLLQIECIDPKEKCEVGDMLLNISRDTSYEENVRADAADVVLRLGDTTQRNIARDIITELGYSSVKTFKTIYSNSQNMHDENISASIAKYIEKLMDAFIPVPWSGVKDEISAYVAASGATKGNKYSIYQALNRIELDTAWYTTKKVTLAEILVAVWQKMAAVRDEGGDDFQILGDRLMEELQEMSDTCSSGHAGRLVNIFSGVDDVIKISFKSQVLGNIAGRLMAKMRELDNDERESIMDGMLPDADEEDKEQYHQFIDEHLPTIREELYKEFVGEKYITEDEFNGYYDHAKETLKTGKIPTSVLVVDE